MTRVHKLHNKVKKDDDYGEDEIALRLGVLFRNMRMIPQPVCCFDAKNNRSIFWKLNDEYQGAPGTGFWHILLAPNYLGNAYKVLSNDFRSGWDKYDTVYKVAFCPFCGEKLPEVRKKEVLPTPMHKRDDGYCGTCKERSDSCMCLPKEAAYEAVLKASKK